MVKKKIQKYYHSWSHFERYCRNRAENRCILNNNAWRKLKDYHLESFLQQLENPYLFLFMVKLFHRSVYQSVPSMSRYYHRYARKRREEIDNGWAQGYFKTLKREKNECKAK